MKCQSIQLLLRYFTQNHKCEPPDGAERKVKGSLKTVEYIALEPLMFVQNVVPSHHTDVEIFNRMCVTFDLMLV